MGIIYFDESTGRQRVKRRYVWAFWGYGAGMLSAMMLVWLIG